jgi:transaldolase
VFYVGTKGKSIKTILKQYDKVSATPIKRVIKARMSNSTCKTSTKHRKFLSEILKERKTYEKIPVGEEGIIVKFALRKSGVRVQARFIWLSYMN